jgi:hypothetical protein
MSLRLWITAFDFERMKSWFGSNDQNLYKKLLREMDDWAQPQDNDELAIFKDARVRLNSLITDGLVPSTKKEKAGDAWAVYVLARHAAAQPQPWDDETEEEEWSWDEMSELHDQLGPRFDKNAKAILKYFVDGRPLLGKRFSDDGDFYAYLTKSEVAELQSQTMKVSQDCKQLLSSGRLNKMDFDSGLLDAMDLMEGTFAKIQAAGLELFMYAS